MFKNGALRKIVTGIAWSLVLLGLTPPAQFCWWEVTHNPRPVSMPLPLSRGEYPSPFFKTEADESYQIDIQWDDPTAEWKALDLDWKVVDDGGAVLQQGTYNYRLRGNTAALGRYQPTRPLRQRIIVHLLQDSQGLGLAHPKLEVTLPERSLDAGYGYLYAVTRAFHVGGPGVLLLLFLLIGKGFTSLLKSNAP
jgi:hypothetical protein